MKKTPRSIPSKRRFPGFTLVIVAIIGAIILLLLKNSDFDNKKTAITNNNTEQSANSSSNTIPAQPSPLAPDISQNLPKPSLPPAEETAAPHKNTPCQDISANLHKLFGHLEQQKYIKAYIQKEPIEAELNRAITKLLDTPPTNSNETADLLSVIGNSSHLFRVLGRKDLSFLKDIITNEHSSIEQHFALLYAWVTIDRECRASSGIQLEFPLAKTYEYAAFFLNTLGGQSYLSRRDSTVRTLAKYYCVLIVDQAARQSMNIYAINLPYHLDSVINDITNSDYLENQGTYLATLRKIRSAAHTH